MAALKEKQEEENERQRTFGKLMTSQQREVRNKSAFFPKFFLKKYVFKFF